MEIATGANGDFLMEREQGAVKDASLADKVAMIVEARVLFGSAAARELWASLGLPVVDVTGKPAADQGKLRDRILKLTSGNGGMTIGLIFNRCRTAGRDAVEQEVASLVADGGLRVDRSIAGNGKVVERFIAN